MCVCIYIYTHTHCEIITTIKLTCPLLYVTILFFSLFFNSTENTNSTLLASFKSTVQYC